MGNTSLCLLVCSTVLSSGSKGNMSSLQDPESVLTSGIPHSNCLASLVDVAVLALPLAIGAGLLPVDCSILLGVGCSEPSIPSIESLFLQDLGLWWFDELTEGRRGQAGGNNKLIHVEM